MSGKGEDNIHQLPERDTGDGLTARQRKVLEVIRNAVATRGYPPSLREIGELVGLTSPSSVAHQLSSLERKGYLRRDPNRPRAVDVRGADDDDFGYQPGATIGRVRPRKVIREMIEDDPELLHVSINAFPTGARSGVAPWNPAQKGMLIEGIRSKPQGSVDWVPRGGAGGRVLQEVEQRAVYLIEHHYADREDTMPNWTDFKNLGELAEAARGENPELAKLLESATADGGGSAPPAPAAPPAGDALSRADVQRMLEEQREELLAEAADAAPSPVVLARERRAAAAITAAGLPDALTEGLRRRYSIHEDGSIGGGLLLEAAGDKPASQVFADTLEADIKQASAIVESAIEHAGPRVRGMGGSYKDSSGAAQPRDSFFRDFMQENAVSQPFFKATRRRNDAHQIEQVGEKLREMMPWIKANKLVDSSKN